MDYYLKPLMTTLPFFLKDTADFLGLLDKTFIPEQCLLGSFEVQSLYTVIPHNVGIEHCMHFLDLRSNKNPPSCFLANLMRLVLTKNYFRFEKDFYLQRCGTAMGTRMAPNYANLHHGFVEKCQVLDGTKNKLFQQILLYECYTDDIFVLFQGDLRSLYLVS